MDLKIENFTDDFLALSVRGHTAPARSFDQTASHVEVPERLFILTSVQRTPTLDCSMLQENRHSSILNRNADGLGSMSREAIF
jgi:hypothetical protein